MPKKNLTLLLALLQTHYCIPCEKSSQSINTHSSDEKTEFATYSYDLHPGLKIPIDLLINEDTEQPGTEPGIDYRIYTTKKGNHWPDWDWDGEKKESTLLIIETKPGIQSQPAQSSEAEKLPIEGLTSAQLESTQSSSELQRAVNILFCCYGRRSEDD